MAIRPTATRWLRRQSGRFFRGGGGVPGGREGEAGEEGGSQGSGEGRCPGRGRGGLSGRGGRGLPAIFGILSRCFVRVCSPAGASRGRMPICCCKHGEIQSCCEGTHGNCALQPVVGCIGEGARTSEASCRSLSRWLSAIVERYSHVRRARRFQPAVRRPASFLAAPISADLGPSHMFPDEEADTAASCDQTAAVAASSTEWLEIPPIQRRRFADWRNCPTHPSVTPLMRWNKRQHCHGCKGAPPQSPLVPKTSMRDGWVCRHVVW